MLEMSENLTIIMPTYNGMLFLPNAVESLLQQTYKDFHLIIIDDGSTDDSWKYLASITDPRVEVQRQTNKGLTETINRAAANAKSEFIAFLDQDDIALPSRLQEQMDFLANHPNYACVLCLVSKVTASGREFGYYKLGNSEPIVDYQPKMGCIVRSTMCLRRQAFLQIGGYDLLAYPVDDYEFLLRLWENFKIAIINKPLVQYRVHSSSLTFKVFQEVQVKTRYVETMSQFRKIGKPEISFSEFTRTLDQTNFVIKLIRQFQTHGMLLFRRAGILLGDGQVITGIFTLTGAFLLYPKFVSERLLARRISSNLHH